MEVITRFAAETDELEVTEEDFANIDLADLAEVAAGKCNKMDLHRANLFYQPSFYPVSIANAPTGYSGQLPGFKIFRYSGTLGPKFEWKTRRALYALGKETASLTSLDFIKVQGPQEQRQIVELPTGQKVEGCFLFTEDDLANHLNWLESNTDQLPTNQQRRPKEVRQPTYSWRGTKRRLMLYSGLSAEDIERARMGEPDPSLAIDEDLIVSPGQELMPGEVAVTSLQPEPGRPVRTIVPRGPSKAFFKNATLFLTQLRREIRELAEVAPVLSAYSLISVAAREWKKAPYGAPRGHDEWSGFWQDNVSQYQSFATRGALDPAIESILGSPKFDKLSEADKKKVRKEITEICKANVDQMTVSGSKTSEYLSRRLTRLARVGRLIVGEIAFPDPEGSTTEDMIYDSQGRVYRSLQEAMRANMINLQRQLAADLTHLLDQLTYGYSTAALANDDVLEFATELSDYEPDQAESKIHSVFGPSSTTTSNWFIDVENRRDQWGPEEGAIPIADYETEDYTSATNYEEDNLVSGGVVETENLDEAPNIIEFPLDQVVGESPEEQELEEFEEELEDQEFPEDLEEELEDQEQVFEQREQQIELDQELEEVQNETEDSEQLEEELEELARAARQQRRRQRISNISGRRER